MPPRGAGISRTSLMLQRATQIPDPTQQHPELLTYTPAGSISGGSCDTAAEADQPQGTNSAAEQPVFQIRHYTSKTIPESLLDWCFNIVKATLYKMYLPVWGWSDTEKRKQMEAASSRFVIAFAQLGAKSPSEQGKQDQQQQQQQQRSQEEQPDQCAAAVAPPIIEGNLTPAAMVNYRFEAGYEKEPALYLYEVVVDPAYQRLGLASHLIRLMENMAWSSAMDSVLLTEFVENKAAAALYKRLGFVRDKNTPRAAGYEILSKSRPKSAKK